MRFPLILLALLFAATGAVFGALNAEPVAYDFYFVVLHVPKGVALLGALVAGWLLGGLLVYCALVLRLRRRVRALSGQLQRRPSTTAETGNVPDNHEA
ncbi:MAG TPA: LapA family protein [Rudaea sp.]|nr:LapA family protein [Rudaea sp.]